MNFGPVQTGIYWLVVGSGAIVGIPDRILALSHDPSALNLGLVFVSAGTIALLSLLKARSF